jgi:hypothetical protein
MARKALRGVEMEQDVATKYAALWNVRGVGEEYRAKAKVAAKACGMTIGHWLEWAIEVGIGFGSTDAEEMLVIFRKAQAGGFRKECSHNGEAREDVADQGDGGGSPQVAGTGGEAERVELGEAAPTGGKQRAPARS